MKKGDYFIIGSVLILLLIFGAYRILTKEEGSRAVIFSDNKVFGTFLLSEDTEFNVYFGDNYNTVIIDKGKVSVIDASCPDKYCMHQIPVSHEGEALVCLPNKLIIRIIGGEGDGYDAITQ